MPPRRGVAAVKKPSRRDKYIYVDDNNEEISPPQTSESESGTNGTLENISRTKQNKRHLPKPDTPPLALEDKRGSERRQVVRQESEIHGESEEQRTLSQAELEHALFSDHQDNKDTHEFDQATTLVPVSPPFVSHSTGSRPKKTPKGRLSRVEPDTSEAISKSIEGEVSDRTATLHIDSDQLRQQFDATSGASAESDFPHSPDELDDVDDMSAAYIPPNQHRHMRACMVCSIVRTETQFRNHGCPNCENFLELAHNQDAIQDCTSQVFDGLITVSDTQRSWVARWQRIEGFVPGVYAVQVEGVLPEDVISAAESAGVRYIPRDGSVNEALPTDV